MKPEDEKQSEAGANAPELSSVSPDDGANAPLATIKSGIKMRGLAVAVFHRDDWPKWCYIDSTLKTEYGTWERHTEASGQRCKDEGVRAEPVVIEPEEFLEWSRKHRAGDISTEARDTFACSRLTQPNYRWS